MKYTLPYLALILPFGLLMVVGGINVTESARAAGDDYNVRDILLTEALATLVAGICGGVAQTTPYIGQPAYRAMGGRTGYTVLTGLFLGLGGVFGYLSNLVELIPLAVLAPILIFIAIHITMQAFEATPQKYFAAVVVAFFPAVANMLAIKLGTPSIVAPEHFTELFNQTDHGLSELAVIVMLGNGFIITAMIWASFVTALIDAARAVLPRSSCSARCSPCSASSTRLIRPAASICHGTSPNPRARSSGSSWPPTACSRQCFCCCPFSRLGRHPGQLELFRRYASERVQSGATMSPKPCCRVAGSRAAPSASPPPPTR